MTSACRSKKQLRTRYEPVVLNIIATCNPLSRLKLKKKGRREEKRRGEEGSWLDLQISRKLKCGNRDSIPS